VLANEIHNAPSPIALLDVSERERGHFGSPEAAAQKNGQDGAIT
jgi:hypothetical protein